jgi:UvrD/REP helicase N-terminal domain
MSDESVHAALRSDAPLVLVEAPAGCGKTHQGAEYARDAAMVELSRRPLILTHTHAACSVFAERTQGIQNRVDIRTIDSVIASIAGAYHVGLGLPQNIPAWVRQQDEGYAQLALKIAELVKRHPMIPQALARRHPVVICDEHQDSSGDQHTLAMALLNHGARLRIFADPMQKIFGKNLDGASPAYDWDELKKSAHASEDLDFPHRWKKGCPDLGKWTLAARNALKGGGKLDLKNGCPSSVTVVVAENEAQKYGDYRLSNKARKPIDVFEDKQISLLILTRHNDTARSFRAFFNRRIALWGRTYARWPRGARRHDHLGGRGPHCDCRWRGQFHRQRREGVQRVGVR